MKDTRSIWVMSKVHDSVWITGSVMICYLFLAIYYGLNNLLGFTIVTSSLVIYFLWTVIFDGTHAFATYSRTYFDKDFRTKNIDLLVGSLVLFIAGPLYMLFFYCIATEEQYRAAFLVFNRFGILYAYYHLIRQHWGFVSIYNRKAKITSKTQVFLDSILLWSGTVYAFFYHNTYHYVPFGLAEKLADGISRSDWLLLVKMLLAIFCFNVILKLYVSYKAIKNFEKIFFNLAWIFLLAACSVIVFLFFGLHDSMLIITYTTRLIFLTTIVSYIMYTIFSEIQIKYCYPKFILLFAVLFTHNFILSLPLSYLVAYACITVFHNVQYHAIVRFHNLNKYSNELQYGWAFKLTKNLFLFIILAIGFNFISTLPRASLNFININEFTFYIAAAFFWGVGFHHYVLDSIIWRPSRDIEIRNILNLKFVENASSS